MVNYLLNHETQNFNIFTKIVFYFHFMANKIASRICIIQTENIILWVLLDFNKN